MDPPRIDGLPDRDARRERGEKLRRKGIRLSNMALLDGVEAFAPFFEYSMMLREANTGKRISLLRCQHPDKEDYNGMELSAPVSFYGDDSQLHVHIDTELNFEEAVATYLEASKGPYRLAYLETGDAAHYDKGFCACIMGKYPHSFLAVHVGRVRESGNMPCDTLLANALPDKGMLQVADIGVLVQAQGRRALEFMSGNVPDEEGKARSRVNIYLSAYTPKLIDGLIAAYAPWDVTAYLPNFRAAARMLLKRETIFN